MKTEAKVGAFVLVCAAILLATIYHVSNAADQRRARPLPDLPAVCGRVGAGSGRPVWRHQGGPGDSRTARRAGPHPD